MSNFLFTSSNFHENGTANEPTAWSSVNNNYHLQSSNGSPYYESVVFPNVGDIIAFDAVNRIAGLIITVEVNDVVQLTANFGSVPLGEVATFNMPGVLSGTDIVKVTFSTTDINDAIDVTLWPVGQGVADAPPPEDPAEPPPAGPDTYFLKGFVSIGALASNVPNEVAPLGELSVRSQTFAKDRELFGTSGGNTTPSPISLTVFTSKDADGAAVPTDQAITDALTQFSKWAYEQAEFGVFTSNPEVFRQQVLAEYTGMFYDVTVGPMVHQGSIYLPEWVVMYFNPNIVSPPLESPQFDRPRLKLWFSDAAFAVQYDDFKIEFIAPIETLDLDDFFTLAAVVKTKVEQRTIPELMLKVEMVTDGQPSTVVKSIDFDYHDPLDITNLIKTTWTFVIWGAAGDNLDLIKEELIKWILDNSTHTQEEWAEIFPDIFTSTEFILIPMWNQYAVPNRTLEEGVFSPIVNAQNALTIARKLCVGSKYTAPHIDTHMSIFGVPYKSIAVLACGGPENRNGKNRFEEQFMDYMAVPTTSIDFNRMGQITQQFIMLLNQMLLVAEDMTASSDVPIGTTRIKRQAPNGDIMTYLSASYRNVQYLVATRETVEQYFPPASVVELTLTANGVDGVFTLASGEVGQAYTNKFVAKGGYPPFKYYLVDPKDVRIEEHEIDEVTGDYIASFVGTGAVEVKVRVQDIANQIVTETFTVNVLEL